MPAIKRPGKSLFPAVAAVFVALLLTSTANAQNYHREALRIPSSVQRKREKAVPA